MTTAAAKPPSMVPDELEEQIARAVFAEEQVATFQRIARDALSLAFAFMGHMDEEDLDEFQRLSESFASLTKATR